MITFVIIIIPIIKRKHLNYTVTFDCSAANEKVIANYDGLTNLLIDSMLGMLYSKGVITLREKERIESKSIQHDKMISFLDNVITRSLLNNISNKLTF